MLLQLIVIHYDEDASYIKALLDMLKMQQWVDFNDFEVLIENDGNKLVYPDTLFKDYPFSIQYHVNPWSGRSGVRQYGLDRATADYVMFCDCDDRLLRVSSLFDIMSVLVAQKPDVLQSKFVADHWNEQGKMYGFSEYFKENVWIHGKCFRTAFLREHDIRWNVKLNNFEDSFFVRLVDAHDPKKCFIEKPTYLWKHRDSSCTRNEGHVEMLDYKNKSFSEMELIVSLLEHDKEAVASNFMYALELECYYTLSAMSAGENLAKDYTNDVSLVESRFIKFYKKYHYLVEQMDKDIKSTLYYAMQERFFKNYNRSGTFKLTFEQWIKMLDMKYSGGTK